MAPRPWVVSVCGHCVFLSCAVRSLLRSEVAPCSAVTGARCGSCCLHRACKALCSRSPSFLVVCSFRSPPSVLCASLRPDVVSPSCLLLAGGLPCLASAVQLPVCRHSSSDLFLAGVASAFVPPSVPGFWQSGPRVFWCYARFGVLLWGAGLGASTVCCQRFTSVLLFGVFRRSFWSWVILRWPRGVVVFAPGGSMLSGVCAPLVCSVRALAGVLVCPLRRSGCAPRLRFWFSPVGVLSYGWSRFTVAASVLFLPISRVLSLLLTPVACVLC